MSKKSQRKPVRLAVASSSLEELKQEVEDTAAICQLILRGKFEGRDCDLVSLAINYLAARNDEAGKILEKLDPKAIVRAKNVQAEAPADLESLPQMTPEQAAEPDSPPMPALHAVADANETHQ